MKILVTGANGYVGSRLLEPLLEAGHTVVALVRGDASHPFLKHTRLSWIQADLLEPSSLETLPHDIDVAYFLVHAMSYSRSRFPEIEEKAVLNFIAKMKQLAVKQVIYLSGLSYGENLSPHLLSRYRTECHIKESGLPFTVLRAAIIIGPGSASFEIIRDLVEKLPFMITPKWVNSLCQPIAISDVLYYLTNVVGNNKAINQVFDMGGPSQLTYKEMLLGYAKVRGLKRYIMTVPFFTPRISSYWLYFITSVNFTLAASLVDSLHNDAICQENRIQEFLPRACLSYHEAVKKALINEGRSWKDTLISPELESQFNALSMVPQVGCLTNRQIVKSSLSFNELIKRIWSIGGNKGWYYMGWAWKIRGFMDKLMGGVGLQRGRGNPLELKAGDCLDFWRVIIADQAAGHLLLYAEMKVPGKAWLEFHIHKANEGSSLEQIAIFAPQGFWGYLYWYGLLPIHLLIFRGMALRLSEKPQ